MMIEPDTKDWTWVLDRPCPEGGFDAPDLDHDRIPQAIRDNATLWDVVLETDDAAVRPAAHLWSPLEYACHVRDVNELFAQRLAQMLSQDAPTFDNWDQDAAATAALSDAPIGGSGTEQTEIGGSLSVGDSTNVSSIAFEASGPTSESERYEDNADEDMLATMSRERVGATDRDLPTVAEPASAAASIAAAVLAPAVSGNSSRIAISQPAPVSVRTPPAPPAPAPISVPKIFPVKTPPPKVPISTAPDSLPPPSEKQVKNSGPSPACPQCESPMAWVEAHLRFYCKSCRMYF
jgi:hypothetical protein